MQDWNGATSVVVQTSIQRGVGFVVVVNDELAILRSARTWLEREGLRVATFADARTALDAPELAEANLLVIDYTNPPLGGMGLLQALRLRRMGTPIALLSAWAEEMEERFAQAEDRPVAYFQLPCSFKALAKDIKALVRQDQALGR